MSDPDRIITWIAARNVSKATKPQRFSGNTSPASIQKKTNVMVNQPGSWRWRRGEERFEDEGLRIRKDGVEALGDVIITL